MLEKFELIQNIKMASWSGARKQVKAKPSSFDTVVVSSFSLDDPVTLVATLDSSVAWFGYHTRPYLKMATSQGEVLKSLNVKFAIDHIAVDNNGELLMTVYNGHQVKRLTKAGDVVDVADMAEFQTRGVTVNGLNEIFVCLSLQGVPGLVRKMSPEGKTLKEIRYKKGTQLPYFRTPFRVKQSVNGDLCILDSSTSGDFRQLIVVDEDSNHKFTYPTQNDPMRHRFNPMNVETDMYGNILVGDTSCGIHLLDEDGIYIQFILSKADGLNISRGLSIDPNGKLWVCSIGNEKVYVLKYEEDQFD